MRLNHFLARAGVGSRRSVEPLIAEGRVTINGHIVTSPAQQVLDGDKVTLDGEPVSDVKALPTAYIMFHKPVGVVSTMKVGRESGPCLADMIAIPKRVFPIGRLDRDTSGLLLLTDDGDLAFRLMHPRFEVTKEYLVKLARAPHPRQWERLQHGLLIDGRAVQLNRLEAVGSGKIRLALHEGRKHIVRRLFRELKLTVVELKRVRVGPVSLGRLSLGKWRHLTELEVRTLKEEVGLNAH